MLATRTALRSLLSAAFLFWVPLVGFLSPRRVAALFSSTSFLLFFSTFPLVVIILIRFRRRYRRVAPRVS